MRQPNLVSLYLHIPFCTYRCSYCDFNTYTTLGDVQSDYAAALAKEVEIVGRSGSSKKTINTIFFGGGTPSVMALPDLERILASVDQNFAWDSNREVTLEANPETIDLAYMQGLKSLGINRISFGAQSALAADLQVLGRAHNFQTVVEAVDLTRQAGIDNLSVDLIYGVPGQTVEAVEQTLDAVLPLNLSHMSLYCLTVEPGTALHR
ncbi:MAG: coproporphyrinogen-III oxidase family protein, partial [Chloroflexota bacterium]